MIDIKINQIIQINKHLSITKRNTISAGSDFTYTDTLLQRHNSVDLSDILEKNMSDFIPSLDAEPFNYTQRLESLNQNVLKNLRFLVTPNNLLYKFNDAEYSSYDIQIFRDVLRLPIDRESMSFFNTEGGSLSKVIIENIPPLPPAGYSIDSRKIVRLNTKNNILHIFKKYVSDFCPNFERLARDPGSRQMSGISVDNLHKLFIVNDPSEIQINYEIDRSAKAEDSIIPYNNIKLNYQMNSSGNVLSGNIPRIAIKFYCNVFLPNIYIQHRQYKTRFNLS
jgi:hypothetical protein